MSNCEKYKESIMLYVENRLSPEKAQALHRHVKKCGDCREWFLAFDIANEIANEADSTITAPEGFVEAVMSKLDEQAVADSAAVESGALETINVFAEKNAVISPENKKIAWLWPRVAFCLYVLLMGVGFAVLYNPENMNRAVFDSIAADLAKTWSGLWVESVGAAYGFAALVLGMIAFLTALLLHNEKEKAKA